ncbi:NOL9 kinase, partial [Polyodon spathula]|nr:NOL9 kinase [Polyodon spathula]
KERGFRQPAPDCPLSAAGVVSLPSNSGLVMSERYSAALSELVRACQVEEEGCPVILVRYRCNVLRDLALLGYFSQLQSVDPEPGPALPLHSFTPYQVPMRSVALRVVHYDVAPAHVLYTVNASLVGLCSLAEGVGGAGGEEGPVLLTHTPVCDCLGFGVLRGVDVARGLYFIVTPLSAERLKQVNCMLVGSVALPQDLFRNQVPLFEVLGVIQSRLFPSFIDSLLIFQAGIEGERPYLTSEYCFEIFGAGKLKKRKNLKRREHLGAPSWKN